MADKCEKVFPTGCFRRTIRLETNRCSDDFQNLIGPRIGVPVIQETGTFVFSDHIVSIVGISGQNGKSRSSSFKERQSETFDIARKQQGESVPIEELQIVERNRAIGSDVVPDTEFFGKPDGFGELFLAESEYQFDFIFELRIFPEQNGQGFYE